MADHAYPQDLKDPAVFVDMTHDDPSTPPPPPPPPFSAEDEASEPLLGTHEKEDSLPPSPPSEDPQPRGGRCFFMDRFGLRRCTSEERAQRRARRRKILFRISLLAVFLWVFSAFCPMEDDGNYSMYYDDGYDLTTDQDQHLWQHNVPLGSALDSEGVFETMANCRQRDLVPWNGTHSHKTKAHQLRITFGDGNMAAKLHVRADDVKHTRVYIRANVTKVPSRDGHDGDQDGDDGNQGLHVNVLNLEDLFDLYIWADARVSDHDGDSGDIPPTPPTPPTPSAPPAPPAPPAPSLPSSPWPTHPPHRGHKHHRKHHRRHHRKHHRKHHDKKYRRKYYSEEHDYDYQGGDDEVEGYWKDFCAVVEVDVVVPRGHKDFTTLAVQGTVLSVDVEDLDTVHFESIQVSTKFGNIQTGALRTDEVAVTSAAGGLHVQSVQSSTPGSVLRVSAESGAGDVELVVKTSAVKAEDETIDSTHRVSATTNLGKVHLSIIEADEVRLEGKTVPGDVDVQARSSVGDVFTTISLKEDQELSLRATSVMGNVNAFVEDRFLGQLSVSASLGKADVVERVNSESVIEYEKNTGHKKVGYKFIEDTGRTGAGSITVDTFWGHALLAFEENVD